MAKSWLNNVGVVMRGPHGPFILLGNPKDKNDKYKTTVELVLKDAKGNVIATEVNPLISMQDPRRGLEEEDAAKVPEKLRYKLAIPPAKE